jgi:hypothetical protein
MDTEIYERLAKVETRLDVISTDQAAMASDVRTIRDHVIAEKAAIRRTTRLWAGTIAFSSTAAALWGAFGEQIRRFFG